MSTAQREESLWDMVRPSDPRQQQKGENCLRRAYPNSLPMGILDSFWRNGVPGPWNIFPNLPATTGGEGADLIPLLACGFLLYPHPRCFPRTQCPSPCLPTKAEGAALGRSPLSLSKPPMGQNECSMRNEKVEGFISYSKKAQT